MTITKCPKSIVTEKLRLVCDTMLSFYKAVDYMYILQVIDFVTHIIGKKFEI
jgi:hypothetical protein